MQLKIAEMDKEIQMANESSICSDTLCEYFY